jgi:hypothetical protein
MLYGMHIIMFIRSLSRLIVSIFLLSPLRKPFKTESPPGTGPFHLYYSYRFGSNYNRKISSVKEFMMKKNSLQNVCEFWKISLTR